MLENKFNAQTKSSIREVESRLNFQHENEMKQAKMGMRAMGLLREEHASRNAKIRDGVSQGKKRRRKRVAAVCSVSFSDTLN